MRAYLLHYNGIPITKADVKEMEQVFNSGDKRQMKQYLMTHRPETPAEVGWYEKLRMREMSLKQASPEK